MTKVQKISKNLTPFAGVFFANDEFKRSWLRKLIDNQLGIRSSAKTYSYGNWHACLSKNGLFAMIGLIFTS